MFKENNIFSSFSVNDLAAAKDFYGNKLGIEIEEGNEGLTLKLRSGGTIFIYPKENHSPASYTILNISVSDIDAAAEELIANGIELERYEGFHQDEKGIARAEITGDGPDIAWFKDPAGNVLAITGSDKADEQ